MKQGEATTAPMGDSTLLLRECSNGMVTTPKKVPHLTLMQPDRDDDEARHVTPAKSMVLTGSEVEQLYQFLKAYYEQ